MVVEEEKEEDRPSSSTPTPPACSYSPQSVMIRCDVLLDVYIIIKNAKVA